MGDRGLHAGPGGDHGGHAVRLRGRRGLTRPADAVSPGSHRSCGRSRHGLRSRPALAVPAAAPHLGRPAVRRHRAARRQRRAHRRDVGPPRRPRPAPTRWAARSPAIGQLTALLGTYLALVQLVLMSRSPWLDEAFGMDRLAVVAPLARVRDGVAASPPTASSTLTGYALNDGASLVDETITIVGTFPFVLWAVAGFALFVLVGVTSLRAARRRLSYETWFGLHLYAYLAIALAFAPPAVHRRRLHPRPDRRRVLDRALRRRGAADRRVPVRPARLDVVAPPAPRLGGRARGAGHRLDLPHRPRPRPPPGALRPVLRVPLPRPATAGGAATRSRSARRPTATGSGSRSRRWATTAPGSRRCRSARRVFVEGPYGVLTGARRTRPRRDAHRGRDRDRAAARAARVAARQPRRPDPRLPREPPARPRVPARARPARRAPRRACPLRHRPPRRRARRPCRRRPDGSRRDPPPRPGHRALTTCSCAGRRD